MFRRNLIGTRFDAGEAFRPMRAGAGAVRDHHKKRGKLWMMAIKREPARTRAAPLRAFANEEVADIAGSWILALLGNPAEEARAARSGLVLTKAQSEGVNTSGGFLVPDQLMASVIDVREKYGSFRANAQIAPMGSDSVSIARRISDPPVGFISEGGLVSEGSVTWDNVNLNAKKLGALVKVSNELDE